MTQSPPDPTESWIGRLQAGDHNGATQLWQRYYKRLVHLAYQRLSGSEQRLANEEDVVVSAFKSFFRALEENRTPDLLSEDEIWRLLVTLTARKAIKVIRHESSDKRNHALLDTDEHAIENIIGNEPTPEFAVAVIDEFRMLSDQLVDDEMRTVAARKMEGYSNAEIAQELDCSVRTIKRRLAIIRSLLMDAVNAEDD